MNSEINYASALPYPDKCVRCGQCRFVCPVLGEMKKESTSPRGKLFLANLLGKGKIEPSSKTSELLSLCLACGACTSECPSGIEVHKKITSARSITTSLSIHNFEKHFLKNSLTSLPVISKIPGFPWLFKKILANESGLETRKTALSTLPRISYSKSRQTRLKIGYFLGCATNILLPEIAFKTVAILNHLGCDVVTPSAFCCGLPLETSGESRLVENLLNKNYQLFHSLDLDAIVTDCSSCSYSLTENSFGINNLPVYELTEFLEKILDPPRPEKVAEPIATACHEPCHLKYGRGLSQQMEWTANFIPGIKKTDLPNGSLCCGAAGTFSLKQKELSKKILTRNLNQIKSSGAAQVITSCPSCTFQISSGGLKVVHPAQLIHKAYGLSD